MLRVKRTFTERTYIVHVAHLFEVLVIPDIDLLDLVRGTEAVKKVYDRDAALYGCKMSDCTEVHNFLRVRLCQHREAGLTAGIDVGMVAENVERVGGNSSRGNVEHSREQFTCDFIHVWNH